MWEFGCMSAIWCLSGGQGFSQAQGAEEVTDIHRSGAAVAW